MNWSLLFPSTWNPLNFLNQETWLSSQALSDIFIHTIIFIALIFLIWTAKLTLSSIIEARRYLNVLKKENAIREVKALSDNSLNYIIYFITEIIDQYLKLYFKGFNYNINLSENSFCKFIDDINFSDIKEKYFKRNKFASILELYNALYQTFRYFDNESFYLEYKKIIVAHIHI